MSERYRLGISKVGREDIVSRIQNGEGVFVSATSRYRSVWLVGYRDRIVRVVYSKRTKDLVTALPINKYYIWLWHNKKLDNEAKNELDYTQHENV